MFEKIKSGEGKERMKRKRGELNSIYISSDDRQLRGRGRGTAVLKINGEIPERG